MEIISWQYIKLEINLIIRNKKPKENLYQIILIYLVMILMFMYINNNSNQIITSTSPILTIFMSIFCGVFIYLHGLFLLTWESTFFEGLNALNINMFSFLKSKFWLLLLSMVLLLFVTSMIFLFSYRNFLFPLFAVTFFNAGICIFLIIIYSLFNNERAELNKSIFLNNEGYGFWQYLFMMGLIALPTILILFLRLFFNPNNTYIILVLLGILSFLFSGYWFKTIHKIYIKRKYIILKKFNERL